MKPNRLFNHRSDRKAKGQIDLPGVTAYRHPTRSDLEDALFNQSSSDLSESSAWGTSPIESYFANQGHPEDRWTFPRAGHS